MTRISSTFSQLKANDRSAFVAFIMAHDPDFDTSLALMRGLPEAGADIIEIGMPFSDPMADGPAIQLAGQRAIASGATMARTLEQVRDFRAGNDTTPIVLMGYFNPLMQYGVERFCRDAKAAGVDGLIIVDLPPEEEEELVLHLKGLDFIRLITPTSDSERINIITARASGFLYYVSVTGITGAGSAAANDIREAVQRIRQVSDLPVAVGFGIKSPEQVQEISAIADAAVVGSAIVKTLAETGSVEATLDFVRKLSQ